MIMVHGTSNGPQQCIGNYLGPCSSLVRRIPAKSLQAVGDWPALKRIRTLYPAGTNFKPGGWDVVPRIRVSHFGTPEL